MSRRNLQFRFHYRPACSRVHRESIILSRPMAPSPLIVPLNIPSDDAIRSLNEPLRLLRTSGRAFLSRVCETSSYKSLADERIHV